VLNVDKISEHDSEECESEESKTKVPVKETKRAINNQKIIEKVVAKNLNRV